MESKTRRLFYRAHQPGGGERSTAACSVSAAVNERAGEMQQRILHGVTAVKAFISPLNHNGRSQYFFFSFFFPGVLWSFGDLSSVYLVSLAARDAFLSSYIFFLLYWLYKEERRFIIFFFLGQSKHGRLFMS